MAEITLDTVKDLSQCQETPCISIYMSTSAVRKGEFKKLEIEFNNLIQKVEKKLKNNWGFKKREIEKLLKEAVSLANDNSFWQEQEEGLAVFISPERFNIFKLAVKTYNKTHVSYNFNIKQLISEIHGNQEFHLLALSPNYNQLYKLNRNNIKEVVIEELPVNLKDFLNLDEEAAEKYQSISTAGKSTVFHGQGAAADEDNEDLIRYLKEISKVINLKLKDKDSYILAAADDNLFSFYKKINSSDKLLEDNLSGNIKDLNKKELLERSWETAAPYLSDDLNQLKEKYHDLKSGNKSSTKLEDIVEAAHHGKVKTLLLNKKAEKAGVFVEEDNEIKETSAKKDYDLYNLAAAKTVINGGDVFSIDKEKMPDKKDIAAIYRY